MKNALTILFSIFVFVCTLSAQKVKPIQVQQVDTSMYVVEYIPIGIAQANVDRQLVQVNKQLETVEKQMAELVAKRDDLMKQKAALELIDKQLYQAAATAGATPVEEKKAAEPTKASKKPKKSKKATKKQ